MDKFRLYLNDNVENFCTGCAACTSVCPTKALSIGKDKYGYNISQFDRSKCINCDRCEGICPVLNYSVPECNTNKPQCYAVQMMDAYRKKCSSGGVFGFLAESIINVGGVVYGAVWNVDYSVSHVRIDTIEGLAAAFGSKYVQSDISQVYQSIKKDIKDGKKILFCGTPCEIAGLNSVIKNKNLFVIDVLCFYAPSALMFQSYVKENYPGDSQIAFTMRDKRLGWNCTEMSAEYQNDRGNYHEIRRRYEDSFETAFHDRILMSEHCEKCKFATMPRQGDLTLGDFWKIGIQSPEICDSLGTSAVFVNNDKGEYLFKEISSHAKNIKSMDIMALKGNRFEPSSVVERSQECKSFYRYFPKCGFNRSVDNAIHGKRDVGIVGCYDVRNYGSHLTYYALYKTLEKLGYSCLMIGCPKDAKYKSSGRPELFSQSPYDQRDVIKQYHNKQEMINANQIVSKFVVGSDQIWNDYLFHYFGEFGLLQFALNDHAKIAYATSFGESKWEGSYSDTEIFKFFLARFNAISAREESGVNLLKKIFGVKAVWNIDPIFFVNKEEYCELASKGKFSHATPYIAAYILDYSSDKEEILLYIGKKLNLDIVVVTDPNKKVSSNWKIPVSNDLSEEDWIAFLSKSSYVYTDSFHGMCMAMIFNKPFIAIANALRGKARFDDYGSTLNIQDRIVYTARDAMNENFHLIGPDYSILNNTIEQHVKAGISWLSEALSDKEQNPLNDYDFGIIERYNDKFSVRIRKTIDENRYLSKLKKYGIRGSMSILYHRIFS